MLPAVVGRQEMSRFRQGHLLKEVNKGVGERCEQLGVGEWSSNRQEDVTNPIPSDEEPEARHCLPAEKKTKNKKHIYERTLKRQSFRKDMKDWCIKPLGACLIFTLARLMGCEKTDQ